MADETSVASALRREISPARRMARSWALYAVVVISFLAIYLLPNDPVAIGLVVLAGFNLITLITYLEEATNKWTTSEI